MGMTRALIEYYITISIIGIMNYMFNMYYDIGSFWLIVTNWGFFLCAWIIMIYPHIKDIDAKIEGINNKYKSFI
jgi:hypothetical protein